MASLAVEEPSKPTLLSLPPIVQCLVSDYVGDFLFVHRSLLFVCKDIRNNWTGSMKSIIICNVKSERLLKGVLEEVLPRHAKSVKTLVLDSVSLSARQLGQLEDSDLLTKLIHLRISNIRNELNFWNCGFTGNLGLKKLEIERAPVTYVASLVTHCRSLTTLSLTQIPDFGDGDLSALASVLPSLTHIKLSRVMLTDLGVSHLIRKIEGAGAESSIKRLELSSRKITGAVFEVLMKCKSLNLSELNVSGCNLNSPDALRSFVRQKGKWLVSLGIGSSLVDDSVLAHGLCMPWGKDLNPLPQLSILNLTGASISGRGVHLLAECYGHQLKELHLGWCTQVDSDGMGALSRHATILEVLTIDKCRRIRIHDIVPLLANCSTLRQLSCKDTPISRSAYEKEAKRLGVHGRILYVL